MQQTVSCWFPCGWGGVWSGSTASGAACLHLGMLTEPCWLPFPFLDSHLIQEWHSELWSELCWWHSSPLRLVPFLILQIKQKRRALYVCVRGETEETPADISVLCSSSLYSEGGWKILCVGMDTGNKNESSFLWFPLYATLKCSRSLFAEVFRRKNSVCNCVFKRIWFLIKPYACICLVKPFTPKVIEWKKVPKLTLFSSNCLGFFPFWVARQKKYFLSLDSWISDTWQVQLLTAWSFFL